MRLLKKLLKDERGFTLIEMLVATTAALIIFGAAVELFTNFWDLGSRATTQSQTNAGVRRAMDRMAVQIRNATSPTTNNPPVERFSNYEVVFLAPTASATTTNNPRGLTHMRYCLNTTGNPNNEVIWFQTIAYSLTSQPTPPSSSACPASGWTTQAQVATNVVNAVQSPAKDLFTFATDSSGNVIEVSINAYVDDDVTKSPSATQLQSRVVVRNLNRAPSAGLTCAGQSNGHAICDASTSSDPDGDSVTFSWTLDGSPLATTSYRVDQSGLASGSSHTFAVTVTDPGGLTSSQSRSVTMP